jgi:predicted AAA+ superfamily ATPase
MPNIDRVINLSRILKAKSAFLLGPRQTGKTSAIRTQLSDFKTINLLLNDTFLAFTQNKRELRDRVTKKDRIVIIDEIQRLPELLNEVQYLIEELGTTFLLTGSSARKLRRQGVNLLGGRARQYRMRPFCYPEIKEEFQLDRILNRGLLPSIYFSDSPALDLASYVGLYLKEEIAAEALTRNIEAFSRFLQTAALSNGQIINHTNIANDAQVPRTTIIEYFSILNDTLFSDYLEPWRETKKRKSIATSKFYFFDVGVVAQLQQRGSVKAKSPLYGDALEAYIHHELRCRSDYVSHASLNFWRSTTNFEVDFIYDNRVAIEVKAKPQLGKKDLSGIRALKEENNLESYHVVYIGDAKKVLEDGVELWPVHEFLDALWNGSFDK